MVLKYAEDGINKFGFNPDVDTALEDIWDGGGNYVFPTEARIHAVVSNDTDDDGKATGTLTLVSAIVGDIAVVNGLSYTGVSGTPEEDEFDIDTSDTAAAASLAAQITTDTRTGITVPTAVVVATSAVGVVTINVDGVIGNLVDISSVDSTITASAATLADVGVGAQSMEIQGIGSDGLELSETIFLNGTTAVNTENAYTAINRMIVLTAGSAGENAGVITATAATDSTVTAQINIGNNQTQMAIYTVPADIDLFLTQYYVGIGKTTSALVDGDLRIKPFGETFQTKHTIPANSTGTSNSQHQFEPWVKVTAKSIIKIRAISSAVNTIVFAGFDGVFSTPN